MIISIWPPHKQGNPEHSVCPEIFLLPVAPPLPLPLPFLLCNSLQTRGLGRQFETNMLGSEMYVGGGLTPFLGTASRWTQATHDNLPIQRTLQWFKNKTKLKNRKSAPARRVLIVTIYLTMGFRPLELIWESNLEKFGDRGPRMPRMLHRWLW